jgi:hypothetical protein
VETGSPTTTQSCGQTDINVNQGQTEPEINNLPTNTNQTNLADNNNQMEQNSEQSIIETDNNQVNFITNNDPKTNPIYDFDLANQLKGKILLQVESHGEAWYVNPADGKRYYMKDGATAYEMMKKFGLGITNADLTKLPQENEKNNYPSLVNRLKGKILLQVEDHGEAWYVNPKTGYRHYLKDGEAAHSLMRYYSLGITNNNLEKIPEGSLD